MKVAGIREARQKFSALLDEVKRGNEVIITEHGREVARLVPRVLRSARPFRSHRAFRDTIHLKGEPLSRTVIEGREDRI